MKRAATSEGTGAVLHLAEAPPRTPVPPLSRRDLLVGAGALFATAAGGKLIWEASESLQRAQVKTWRAGIVSVRLRGGRYLGFPHRHASPAARNWPSRHSSAACSPSERRMAPKRSASGRTEPLSTWYCQEFCRCVRIPMSS